MEIVDKLRQWRFKEAHEAADIIERMQEWNDNAQEKIGELETEIERLRQKLKKYEEAYELVEIEIPQQKESE